jgi:uncharacterized RDD family membrane protein YckC
MNPTSSALRAARLLAALIPFAVAAFAADPAKPQDAAAPAPEAPLHEIGAAAAPTPTPALSPTPTPAGAMVMRTDTVVHQFDDEDHNRVSVGDSTYVGPDEKLEGNAVAVMGPVTVDGTVEGNCVSVMGSNTINGTVHGNAVVILGTMRIGPHARIDGNAVAGVGIVIKEPGAVIGGNVVQQGGGMNFADNPGAHDWWDRAFRRGRPLAFGPHLTAFWLLSICTVGLYILLALVFPGGVTKCGNVLVERPGITLLTGILAIIALPVVFILLCVTIVGIPIAFVVLPIGVMACVTFGKASLYALIGRSILGKGAHPVLAVFLGVGIVIGFYLVPFVGGLLWVIMAFLGYACAVTALFTSRKPAPPLAAPPAAPVPSVPPSAVPPSEVPPVAAELAATPPALATAMPPPLAAPAGVVPAPARLDPASEAALPRAGFWIRMVALLVDFILVAIVTRMHDWFPVVLAIYGALLWKLRGATIGDIIFGLKVVRADGGAMEWVTVVVRALACFFSAVVVGLGFIWIAFDPEKQGWHDKIAGTLVVRLPRGASLV